MMREPNTDPIPAPVTSSVNLLPFVKSQNVPISNHNLRISGKYALDSYFLLQQSPRVDLLPPVLQKSNIRSSVIFSRNRKEVRCIFYVSIYGEEHPSSKNKTQSLDSSTISRYVRRGNRCKTLQIPDPATPTVAAPAPMNLAAESMSRRAIELWRERTAIVYCTKADWLTEAWGADVEVASSGSRCVYNDHPLHVLSPRSPPALRRACNVRWRISRPNLTGF